ncbi:Matrix metalloproteinase-14 [Apostichopus japonicus]|uniref:Matrix metalloproteinase-14 n=1 Tax=Stichopus japonicus TaxID=307972 RepID=A0A2G8L0B3_STIJA|nr:Matrix metalloproteinase-14 [Apostichopus japonicus]
MKSDSVERRRHGVASGYPKPYEVFPGLPTNLDAAVYWPNENILLFKGNQYWRTSGTTVDNGYPLIIACGWPGLPDDIDAAVVWGRNRKGYFFKGTQYWRFILTRQTERVHRSYLIAGYNQGTADAAIQWSNGRTFLFKDELYWLYNDANDLVDSGYPLWTTKHWLGCPTNGPTVSM